MVRHNGSEGGRRFAESFMEASQNIHARMSQEAVWLAGFRRLAAVHDNNGWVDRERKTIKVLADPRLNRGVRVGSLVALMDPYLNGEFQLVEITAIDHPGQRHNDSAYGLHYRHVGPKMKVPQEAYQ
jgi:hypothetical protein